MDHQQLMSLFMLQNVDHNPGQYVFEHFLIKLPRDYSVTFSANTCLAEKENRDRRIAPTTQRVNSPNKLCPEIPLSISMPKSIGDAAVLITARDVINARMAPRFLVP